MTDIPTVTQKTITAGDSVSWVINLTDYPASESWELSYVLLNSSSKITITSEADGDSHLIDVSAATTAAYTAGEYKYTALITDGTDRYTVETGTITMLPDPAEQTTYDGRTFAEVCLENIESILQGKASADNYSYSIGGRSLSKYSWDELITARNYFANEVRKEQRNESGKTQSNLIKMRFV